MFNNISGKIKLIAKIMCWVGIIFCGAAAIILLFAGVITDDIEQIQLAIMSIIMGLVSYVCSCLVYGFGQLIENTSSLNGIVLIEDKDEPKQEKPKQELSPEDITASYLASFLEEEKKKAE